MALKNPVSARDVQQTGEYSLQVTLPQEILRREELDAGDEVPAKQQRGQLVLRLEDETADAEKTLSIVPIGNSLGVTIPAGMRREHDLERGDTVYVRATPDDVYVRLE